MLLTPMPLLDKFEHYLQLLLIVTVYLIVITEQLPYHADVSFIERLVIIVFLLITLVTLFTLFVQLFLDDNNKEYRIPLLYNLVIFYFTKYNK